MTAPSSNWNDLAPRVISGIFMIVVGLAAVWAGGIVFQCLVAALCGAMVWELVRMVAPDRAGLALQLGAVGAVAVLLASNLPSVYALPLILAAICVGVGQMRDHLSAYVGYSLAILLAGWSLILLRDDLGLAWLVWLVAIVVATDVAGYFAGRLIGGPKFWPAISPKKTWSGTVAGWLAAAVVGVFLGVGGLSVVLSVFLSFASQMGDIAESALKRRIGVKDSSNLIPGHGGVLDRFDGMLGAALAFGVLHLIFDIAQVPL